MKRQPIFNRLMWQEIFNCHYMQPTQIRTEQFSISMPPFFLLWWSLYFFCYQYLNILVYSQQEKFTIMLDRDGIKVAASCYS